MGNDFAPQWYSDLVNYQNPNKQPQQPQLDANGNPIIQPTLPTQSAQDNSQYKYDALMHKKGGFNSLIGMFI